MTVNVDSFNGTDNNEPVFPSVGQHLAWDTWHTVSLSINPLADRYISITVDGQTQSLSSIPLPRDLVNGLWVREPLIEDVYTQIIPTDVGGFETSDDVYWDNLSVTVVPEPTGLALATIALFAPAMLLRHKKRDLRPRLVRGFSASISRSVLAGFSGRF